VRIVTTTVIRRPIEQVFDFLTTPGNWPLWHPSSQQVTGAVDHSLLPGEQATEDFVVAGQAGRALWTVRERRAPQHWIIDGVAESGARATITYTLRPSNGGTAFERVLDFTSLPPGLPAEAHDAFHRQVDAESTEALRRLKEILDDSNH